MRLFPSDERCLNFCRNEEKLFVVSFTSLEVSVTHIGPMGLRFFTRGRVEYPGQTSSFG